jgi:hypothetical protein
VSSIPLCFHTVDLHCMRQQLRSNTVLARSFVDNLIPILICVQIKKRAAGFCEPMRSMIANIPPDNPTATCLRLADFPASPWDNANGLVTLAGDAAHAMTMYRGEGANHGILDAALLLDQLKRIWKGECSQADGIKSFEAEMQERTHVAVLRSRQAAYDGHDWEAIHDGSPLIGLRVPPATA